MLTLIAMTFSMLKGVAIAVVAVNVVVLAASLVCLFFTYRSARKEEKDKEPSSSVESSK